MSWPEFLLTVHLLAAIIWLGGSCMLLILGHYMKRTGSIQSRVDYTRMTEKVGSVVFTSASILVIVAGSLLVNEFEGFDYDQAWIMIGYAGWFVSFLLGVGFYPREGKRREKVIESAGFDDPGVEISVNRVLTVAAADTAIITLVLLAMTTKPGF